ncbi:MAG: sporulation membrane protein YtaF [Clostridiales bacterium]|nr:sporulation membrane protein YtaF [Clostridiales bacterium]MDY2730288.1 sporulation membrane protein YtaF [Clostridium sp.]
MIPAFLLIASVCIDAFIASMAYGTSKIKIPFTSSLLISFIGSFMLGISLFFGSFLKDFLPEKISIFFSFSVLMIIGIYKLFEGLFKAFIRKGGKTDRPLKFKIFDINFVLQVYADEVKADFDKSKTLTLKEAFYLSIALSFDSLATGIAGSALIDSYILTIFLCFVMGIILIYVGVFIGTKLSEKTNLDLSWLSGFLLMLLAFSKFFK